MAAPFTHTTRRQILFGECDAAGIVYYPRYFEMFDANTSALFSAATGLSHHQLEKTYGTLGWPMVKAATQFHTPSTYGDTVVITSTVTRIGASSIGVKTTISHEDGRLIVETEDVRVWAVVVDGKITSAPVPVAVRAKLLA